MNKLILTMGLPRSGKSTWARSTGHVLVEMDNIRLAMHGNVYIASAEPLVKATAKIMVDTLFLSGNETIVLDATHTRKEERNFWLSSNYDIKVKIFRVSERICIDRAIATGQEYLEPVIRRKMHHWEVLGDGEEEYNDR